CADGRHGHGADPHAAVDLVLGRLLGFEPYARHLGRPIPAPAWLEPLRDGVPDPPQTPRRHGPTRSRPHRWRAAGSCRDRRVMGRRQDARRGPPGVAKAVMAMIGMFLVVRLP